MPKKVLAFSRNYSTKQNSLALNQVLARLESHFQYDTHASKLIQDLKNTLSNPYSLKNLSVQVAAASLFTILGRTTFIPFDVVAGVLEFLHLLTHRTNWKKVNPSAPIQVLSNRFANQGVENIQFNDLNGRGAIYVSAQKICAWLGSLVFTPTDPPSFGVQNAQRFCIEGMDVFSKPEASLGGIVAIENTFNGQFNISFAPGQVAAARLADGSFSPIIPPLGPDGKPIIPPLGQLVQAGVLSCEVSNGLDPASLSKNAALASFLPTLHNAVGTVTLGFFQGRMMFPLALSTTLLSTLSHLIEEGLSMSDTDSLVDRPIASGAQAGVHLASLTILGAQLCLAFTLGRDSYRYGQQIPASIRHMVRDLENLCTLVQQQQEADGERQDTRVAQGLAHIFSNIIEHHLIPMTEGRDRLVLLRLLRTLQPESLASPESHYFHRFVNGISDAIQAFRNRQIVNFEHRHDATLLQNLNSTLTQLDLGQPSDAFVRLFRDTPSTIKTLAQNIPVETWAGYKDALSLLQDITLNTLPDKTTCSTFVKTMLTELYCNQMKPDPLIPSSKFKAALTYLISDGPNQDKAREAFFKKHYVTLRAAQELTGKQEQLTALLDIFSEKNLPEGLKGLALETSPKESAIKQFSKKIPPYFNLIYLGLYFIELCILAIYIRSLIPTGSNFSLYNIPPQDGQGPCDL